MVIQQQAPQPQLDTPSPPAWRSLPFYNCSQASPPSTTFASQPVSQIHSILNLASFPIGVHPTTSTHILDHGTLSASSPTPAPPLHLDSPHLLTTTKGSLVLVDPSTLTPITPPFPSIREGTVTHVEYDALSSQLVLLSEDQGGTGFPLLRIWNLKYNLASLKSPRGNQTQEGLWSWMPRLMAESRVQHGRRPLPIAALTTSPGLAYLACSLSSGAVLLLRKLSATLDAAPLPTVANPVGPAAVLPKFKVVYQPGAEAATSSSTSAAPEQDPVTALAFTSSSEEHHSHRSRNLSLFIATLSKVMKYIVLGKGAGNPPITLDDIGSPLGCSILLPPSTSRLADSGEGAEEEAKLLIARPEAIYTIGSHGREDCYAYEGPKDRVLLLPISRHLVVLSPPLSSDDAAEPSSNSFGRIAGASQTNADGGQEVTKVSIFDLDGKFLSYTGTFLGALRAAFPDSSPSPSSASHREDVLLLSDTGGLHQLSEKPLGEKLDILYRKHLFLLASQVAKSHFARTRAPGAIDLTGEDLESIERLNALLGEIWIKYGDHLYDKGDHEGSMKMGYIKSVGAFAGAVGSRFGAKKRGKHTAGVGESYIIRKFLDAQRIPLLTLYLQELHRRGLANSDHTTLLLNCYTKMKDTASLDKFIRRSHVTTTGGIDVDSSDEESSAAAIRSGTNGNSKGSGGGALPFDLPTAIKVCRSANYFDQAAYLARKFGFGEEYLRIKIEDTNEPFEAIEWLRTRQAAEVIEYLKAYAGLLLSGGGTERKEEAERQTTDLLIELCAGAYRPHVSNSTGAIEQAAKAAKSAGEGGPHGKGFLSYLTGGATTASDPVVENPKAGGPRTGPHIIGGDVSAAPAMPSGGEIESTDLLTSALYDIPSARLYFPHFIPYPQAFRRFLETVALARWGQAVEATSGHKDVSVDDVEDVWQAENDLGVDSDLREQRAIWNTLLGIYLKNWSASTSSATNASRQQTMSIRQQKEDSSEDSRANSLFSSNRTLALCLLHQHRNLPYDVSHALVLCEQQDFTEGIVVLYERLGMYEDILTLWMEQTRKELDSLIDEGDSEEMDAVEGPSAAGGQVKSISTSAIACPSSIHILSSLKRYHTLSPWLYTQVLSFLISHPLLLSKHRSEVEDILVQIEEERLMSTLEIIGLLSKEGGHANVGLIRGFLEGKVREEREEEEADQRLIESYRGETARKEKEIEELTIGEPRVFQSNRCTACGGQLDLPAVHFMCKHSYHARCLGEAENECPSCARAYGVIRDIRKNNEEMAGRHDLFLQEVREADDPFQTLASMFSRGIFSQSALDTT